MADFDYKKFLTESKLKIKVPVKEMARIAKEKYKLNPEVNCRRILFPPPLSERTINSTP